MDFLIFLFNLLIIIVLGAWQLYQMLKQNSEDSIFEHLTEFQYFNIGFTYGYLKNGKLVCRISIRRRDIFCLQYFAPGNGFHGCNVFVDCTGKYQIDTFAGTSLSEVDKIKIKELVEQLMIDEADYVNLQVAFLADDNRLRENLDGKTPEEAIEICKQYEREVLGFELYL